MLPWLSRAFALAAGLVCLVTALSTPPYPYGDAPEYLLMTESLARHGSPDLRQEDLEAVTLGFLRHRVEFPPHGALVGYYPAEDGRRYSYHFWGYSALCLPARYALAAAGVDELKALQVTNALLMGLALICVAWAAPFAEPQKLLLAGLLVSSPAVWFVLWPHPEVLSFSCVTMALVLMLRRRFWAAVLLAAVAALQSLQLGLLVVFLWVKGAARLRLRWRGGLLLRARFGWRESLTLAVPALVLVVHPLFYYWHFGTFSIVALEATSVAKLSPTRALDLLFDLNLGLLPYIPVALLAYLVAVGRAFVVERRLTPSVQLFLLLAGVLLANTLQWNFNHGTSGPSRYVVWLTPLIFVTLAAEACSRRWLGVLALAVAVQLGIVWSRGGLRPRYDYLEHSPVARFVLDRAPWLYHPDYEVFIKRSLHVEGRPTRGPYVYPVDGACRKVLARRDHEALVRERCGFVPEKALAFFRGPVTRESDRTSWTYVDY